MPLPPNVTSDQAPWGRIYPPRPEWLALAEDEEILLPDLEIIDAHHHLWDKPDNRFLLDEALADFSDGHNVVATVWVEADVFYRKHGPKEFESVGETEVVAGIAAMCESGQYGAIRVAQGMTVHAEIRGKHLPDVLDAQSVAAGGRMRGVRQSAAWSDDPTFVVNSGFGPGLLADPQFRNGVKEIARRELVLEIFLFHPQLGEVIQLARQNPDLTIILNHTGSPIGFGTYADNKKRLWDEWSSGIAQLAELPNVIIKLGGLVSRLAAFNHRLMPRPAHSYLLEQAWGPYIRFAIEQFGAERAMFESNFPVEKMGINYRNLWNGFKRIVLDASVSEQEALFAGTARRVYRLQA